MTRGMILLVLWVIIGVLNLATDFNIKYFLCWAMLIVELLQDVLLEYFDKEK